MRQFIVLWARILAKKVIKVRDSGPWFGQLLHEEHMSGHISEFELQMSFHLKRVLLLDQTEWTIICVHFRIPISDPIS